MADKREKMSKSRGNVTLPEEVVYGVYEVAGGYEFRLAENNLVINPHEYEVWRNRPGDSCFYTSTKHGRQPVFLCQCGNPSPCIFLVDGKEIIQHSRLKRMVAVYSLDKLPK